MPLVLSVLLTSLAVQKTSSSYIAGPNRLGIEALPSNTATMPAQAPLPRMITAQSDIVLSKYLAELLQELFDNNDGLLLRRLVTASPHSTHIAYVALRIIVEGTIWVLVDKERRDAQNNTNVMLPCSCFFVLSITSSHLCLFLAFTGLFELTFATGLLFTSGAARKPQHGSSHFQQLPPRHAVCRFPGLPGCHGTCLLRRARE